MEIEESYQQARQILTQNLEKGQAKLSTAEKLKCDIAQAIIYEHDQKRLQAASIYYISFFKIENLQIIPKQFVQSKLEESGLFDKGYHQWINCPCIFIKISTPTNYIQRQQKLKIIMASIYKIKIQ